MTIVFYISGHGFGHASRSIALLRVLAARRPDATLIVRTSAPPWLFRATAPPTIELVPLDTDVGVVQTDSLNLDERETALDAGRFYGTFAARVDAEASFLRSRRATIVLGDIPPLACAAAARAGVTSVAIGNFTWDWIYRGYDTFERLAPGVIGTIRDAYAAATHALRLPMHGGFEPMAAVTSDIPFIAGRSTRDREETRRHLGISGDRPFVLASFGGHGLDIPYGAIAKSEGLTVWSAESALPAPLTHQDLVAAADVVISKPGYGIVSECVASGAPLLYTSRGRFVEYDVFVAEMPRVLRCRYIAQPDLLAGRWTDAVHALLAQPPAPERPRTDGADVAATRILDWVIE